MRIELPVSVTMSSGASEGQVILGGKTRSTGGTPWSSSIKASVGALALSKLFSWNSPTALRRGIRDLMHLLFEHAIRYEWGDRNPFRSIVRESNHLSSAWRSHWPRPAPAS